MQVLGLFKLTNKYSKFYITVNTTTHFSWAKKFNYLFVTCLSLLSSKQRAVGSKTYNLSLPPPALPSKAVISANWEDFLISSQGSILTLVLLRKQIIPLRRESRGGLPHKP